VKDFDVMIGTRDVNKPDVQKFAAEHKDIRVGTFKETAKCIPGFLENSWGHAFKMLRPIKEK
jgi:hypothetical protein